MKGKVKGGKNRKKGWKRVDITEVEDHLEDERLAERTGETPDQVKFVVETFGEKKPGNEQESIVREKLTRSSKTVKNSQDIVSNLFCYKSLRLQSKVKPCTTSRAGPKTQHKLLRLKNRSSFLKKWKDSETQGKKAAAANDQKRAEHKDPKTRLKVYDLWSEPLGDDGEEEDEDIKELEAQQKSLIGLNPKKVPLNRYQKPSLLPSVEHPHPGTSYNPSFEDHQDLLSKAVDVEQKKVKEEAHLKRVVDNFYMTRQDVPIEKVYMKEMTQGLGIDDEEEDGEESGAEGASDEEGGAGLVRNPVVRAENRKSRAIKRRETAQKMIKLNKRIAKDLKRKDKDFFSLKRLKKEIKESDVKSTERVKKREVRRVAKMYEPHKLSQHKYEEQDMPLNLSHELTGSLRSMKTDGNLLEERFKSFQKRNLIEPRHVVLKLNKSKVKKYEKRGDRGDDIKKVRG